MVKEGRGQVVALLSSCYDVVVSVVPVSLGRVFCLDGSARDHFRVVQTWVQGNGSH